MKLWIARDKDGELYLYPNKPIKGDYRFTCGYVYDDYITLNSDDFPEVTFENSPQEVEFKLVNEIVGVAESPLKTFPRGNVFEVGASYRR